MRTEYTSLAIVGVAACIAVYALTQQPKTNSLYTVNQLSSEDMAFVKYVSKYQKSYGTKEEFGFRAETFKNTLAKIAEENAKNDNTFHLGVNKFADWTPAEYKRLLSYKSSGRVRKAPALTQSTEEILKDLPTSIDWRTKGAVNPIKDQGQCGSCWAFSAVGAIEGRFQIKNGTLYDLSEQQLVDCCRGSPYTSLGCDGGEMPEGIAYSHDKGMMNETSYPYTALDGTCNYDAKKVIVTSLGEQAVTANSSVALKAAVAEGPVSVAIEADKIVFQFY